MNPVHILTDSTGTVFHLSEVGLFGASGVVQRTYALGIPSDGLSEALLAVVKVSTCQGELRALTVEHGEAPEEVLEATREWVRTKCLGALPGGGAILPTPPAVGAPAVGTPAAPAVGTPAVGAPAASLGQCRSRSRHLYSNVQCELQDEHGGYHRRDGILWIGDPEGP
jgi:hypothetical protein